MKKHIIVIVLFIFSALSINAQTELWGMMSEGGKYGVGTIYKTDGNGDNFEIQHSFYKTIGQTISSPLTETSNGKIYGLASESAVCKNFGGVLYEYDISTDTYDIKYSFENSENGDNPTGKLLYANNKLYGVTREGGINDMGVIFEFDPSTNTMVKLFDFGGDNGIYPNPLMQAKNGILYGTSMGGSKKNGVIFKYDISNDKYTKLFEFDDDNGSSPRGIFVEVSENKLYGITASGGGNYMGGTIYEFDISTNTHIIKQKLASYESSIGGYPTNSLILADNGKLYGTVEIKINSIGYKLFEYSIDTDTYTLLNLSNSNYLGGALISASNGKLYGTGKKGGSNNKGTIFEFNTSTQTITSLHSFGTDENNAYKGLALMQASNGKLYSCTPSGGESLWQGGLYEFDISTSTYLKKFDFDVSKFGATPIASLIQATNGKLYGMTWRGGFYVDTDHSDDRYGAGTIFEYNPSTSKYMVLFEFNGINGKSPKGDLFQASNGKLYGLTSQGGNTNWGTMFEFDISTNTHKVLYNFDINGDRENGSNPKGGLIQAKNGKLYGFTSRGGILSDGTRVDNGTLFEYDIEGETLSTVYTFDDTNGKAPISKLIQARNDTLYGLTSSGGGYNMWGTLFAFDTDTKVHSNLYSFSKAENYNPLGALTEVIIRDSINLFGITSANSGDNDVIFKYNVQKEELTIVEEFNGNTNYNPLNASLLLASNSNLYGVGPIKDTELKYMFQYNIEGKTLESKIDFTCKKQTGTPLYVSGLIEIDTNYLSSNDNIVSPDNRPILYPNPALNEISIRNITKENATIYIYDNVGKLIIVESDNSDIISIDISFLSPGIYYVKYRSKSKVITSKMIKN